MENTAYIHFPDSVEVVTVSKFLTETLEKKFLLILECFKN